MTLDEYRYIQEMANRVNGLANMFAQMDHKDADSMVEKSYEYLGALDDMLEGVSLKELEDTK